jgi:hypothetical protein
MTVIKVFSPLVWFNFIKDGIIVDNIECNKCMLSLEINTLEHPGWSSLLQQFEDATIYQTWACGSVIWGRIT